MPLTSSDFPEEVQVAFFIFSLLEDRWEGMSGTYMGKTWTNVGYLFSLYEVEDAKVILYIMKMYEGLIVEFKAAQSSKKLKAEERKSAGGENNFTHNVKG